MLTSTDDEREAIVDYFLSQSPKASVSFSQKVYAETIAGHCHEVWDLHTSDGRWWIVTNPTNLYSQEQFPSMDLVVTFHMGLCLRVPRSDRLHTNEVDLMPVAATFRQLDDVGISLNQADSLLGYRAVGVGCREVLISYVQSLQAVADWPKSDLKKSDVKGWAELIFSEVLPGPSNEKRRRLVRASIKEAWDFSNWLTHTSSATWHDAEAAHLQVGHSVNLTASLMIRYFRGVPDACPDCGSPHLSPQSGYHEASPEIEWQRPTCDDCGWSGVALPLRERSADELITRDGEMSESCSTMETPLTGLKRPEN